MSSWIHVYHQAMLSLLTTLVKVVLDYFLVLYELGFQNHYIDIRYKQICIELYFILQ